MTLEIGDKAPDFDLPTDTGRASLSALKGRPVVLYFYPKDDTPGCTNEAKGFSELAGDFAKAGAVVVGVSKDDKESDVIERYGAWVEKSLYGRKYMGIDRSTWLIDGEGVLRGIWRKVRVPGHAETVLAATQALKKALRHVRPCVARRRSCSSFRALPWPFRSRSVSPLTHARFSPRLSQWATRAPTEPGQPPVR